MATEPYVTKFSQLLEEDKAWALRRLPAEVIRRMQTAQFPVFLAGGFLRSIISGEDVSDVDLLVDSKSNAHKLSEALTAYYGVSATTTANAVTIPANVFSSRPAIQIIHRWTFSDAASLIESFDFTIARAAMWYTGDVWNTLCDKRFYADLAAKRLVYCRPCRNEDAGGSMLRLLKFYRRGYTAPLQTIADVAARWMGSGDGLEHNYVEDRISDVLLQRLFTVDPAADPTHEGHRAV